MHLVIESGNRVFPLDEGCWGQLGICFDGAPLIKQFKVSAVHSFGLREACDKRNLRRLIHDLPKLRADRWVCHQTPHMRFQRLTTMQSAARPSGSRRRQIFKDLYCLIEVFSVVWVKADRNGV